MAETIAETERLRLRTWDPADLEEFIRHTNTPAVMRYLDGVWPRERHQTAFERIQRYEREHGHTFWIVECKSDGAMLGFCGLKRVNTEGAPFPGDMEVGWRLREDAWGLGYAKEAAIASIDLAFEKFGVAQVVALTIPPNEPSQGLMKRLGMHRREDLDFKSADVPAGMHVVVYSIGIEDWPSARAAALA